MVGSGVGPGEGTVKNYLPDAHADFVLAVAGEEFGLVLCLVIVGLFGFVVLRGIANLMRSTDLFVVIAATGLLVQFALQALINMGSTTSLMPTKGMTCAVYFLRRVVVAGAGVRHGRSCWRLPVGARGGAA